MILRWVGAALVEHRRGFRSTARTRRHARPRSSHDQATPFVASQTLLSVLLVAAAACEPPPTLSVDGAVRLVPPDCVEHEPARATAQLVDLSESGPAIGLLLAGGAFPEPETVFFSETRVWFADDVPSGFPTSADNARVWKAEPTLIAQDVLSFAERPWIGVQTLTVDERAFFAGQEVTENEHVLTAIIDVSVVLSDGSFVRSPVFALDIEVCNGCLVVPCVQVRPCISGQDEAFGPRCFDTPD